MFSVKLLGGATIEATLGPLTGRAVQRSRMALLALLVASRSRGMSRDKVIAYLWPDADSERGRRNLSDSIYRINQAIGAEAVSSAGDVLRLDANVIASDVGDFEDAIERGDHERAASLYAGPFLDGFFLPDAPEFAHWVDGERDRLGRAFGVTLQALAEAAEHAGDFTAAAESWRRRAGHDPYDARIALRFMRALDASGARAAALQHARVFTSLMREEIGAEPDAEVVRYEAELRRTVQEPASGKAGPSTSVGTTTAKEAGPSTALGTTMEAGPSTSLATTRSRLARYASAAAALLVVVLGAFWMVNRRASSSSARNLVVAVAVLPFIDLSSLKDQEYFSDGITEELITTLSQIEGMHVPSRTSTFAFKGKGTDIKEVGRALAASHIVEGSVRREGERFRISVQLVNVADGYHLWAETYDGDTKDVFAIQTTIARTVAEKLRGKLVSTAPAVASSPAAEVHPEAYDLYMKGRHSLYLKGRYAWYRRSEDGLRTAASYFQQAVNVAPRYARAHAGLADAYAVLGFYDYLPPREAFTTAERAATQALTLDSALGGPHATLGYVNLYYHWDWPRAEAAFQRAIAVDPTYSTAHQWYANLLTAMGRFDDAEREMRRAQELDPLSLIANAALGWVFYFAGDYEQSIAQCRQTLELDPEYALAVIWSGWSMEALGRTPEAIAQYRRAISLTSGSALSVASLARALAASGDRAQATVQLKELEARGARGQYVPAYELAKIHTALGNRDRAFEWLARAYEQRSHSLVFLQVDPQLKSLRGDPRFRRLVGDVGLVAATR